MVAMSSDLCLRASAPSERRGGGRAKGREGGILELPFLAGEFSFKSPTWKWCRQSSVLECMAFLETSQKECVTDRNLLGVVKVKPAWLRSYPVASV